MAVPVECYTVFIRNQAVEAKLGGGIEALAALAPNATFCTDGEIARSSFMHAADADNYLRELEHYGLRPGEDIVCVHVIETDKADCDWLAFGSYENAVIAALVGTQLQKIVAPHGWDPTADSTINHWDREAFAEQFEFVEQAEDGVETYRNRETGELIYSARTTPLHQKLFADATDLAQDHIFLNAEDAATTEGRDTALHRSIEMLEQAVALAPEYWNAWWYMGKCWQALGNRVEARAALHKSTQWDGAENPNTWREYMFECLQMGDTKEGIRAAEQAVGLEPENDGLVSNLALAYLIAARLPEAAKTVKRARKMNREDSVTENLERIIKEVRKGKRPQPSTLADL